MDVNKSPIEGTANMMRNRGRASHSDRWQDMDEVKKVIGGKEVRVGAICKCCKS
jgi:hypothetical protein